MGDRCNVVISTDSVEGKSLAEAIKNQVVIYAHWSGENMPSNVRDVIKRGERLDDPAYLARIVLCQFMVRSCGNNPSAERIAATVQEKTGFGISSGMICDNERPILVIDTSRNKVVSYPGDNAAKPSKEWTFTQFGALTDKQCKAILGDEDDTDESGS